MTTLVHATLTLRRSARSSYGFVAVAAFALLDLLGVFQLPFADLRLEHGVVIAAWTVILGVRVGARSKLSLVDPSGAVVDLEIGLLLLVAVYAVVQVGGGLTGELYPLVYVVVAFLASFARSPMGSLLVVSAVGLEAALYFVTEHQTDARPFALHAAFIIFFGLLNLLFTRVEIARVRRRSQSELEDEREKVRSDSRMFRLVAPSSDSASDEERLHQSSVDEVRQSLYHVLHLLHRSLDLHTCALLMLGDDERLHIAELVTESENIAEGPFNGGEGAVGAVAKRGQTMNLEHIKPGYKGLCYYRGPALIRAFLGVPIVEKGQLRGALCVDRLEDRGFSPREEELLADAVNQVLRAQQNERVFLQLERSKREQTILYRASQALGVALDEDAVIDAGLDAASQIAAYDFAAITLYDPETRKHSVRRALGHQADTFQGLVFRENTSLTAMAVKNRHYLPYRGDFDPRQQTVYTRRANIRGMDSLLILPLIVREDAIGSLALAARRGQAFGDAVRTTLQVLANQLAVSLSNAAAVKRLEEMATTDGLTGCLNKRTFLEEMESKICSAERFGRRLSLVITDIDHFKSVNDTYGHATGDVVIKELGAILQRMKRETDIVARFGGEEFCILCEETDTEGAVLLAERIREEVGGTVFNTELGKLSCKASLGVASFPEHGKTGLALFEAADKALYDAKGSGRNRVCRAG